MEKTNKQTEKKELRKENIQLNNRVFELEQREKLVPNKQQTTFPRSNTSQASYLGRRGRYIGKDSP